MPPLQLAGSELNSTFRLSIQWGPGPPSFLSSQKSSNIFACITALANDADSKYYWGILIRYSDS